MHFPSATTSARSDCFDRCGRVDNGKSLSVKPDLGWCLRDESVYTVDIFKCFERNLEVSVKCIRRDCFELFRYKAK